MGHSRRSVMYPTPTGLFDNPPYAINAKPFVVVATDRKNRCDFAERANQLTQPAKFRRTVDQVAAEQHCIRIATAHGIQHLLAQRVGAIASEVEVADIQQPVRVSSF